MDRTTSLIPAEVEQLARQFERFSGVGPRAARRMTRHLLLNAKVHQAFQAALAQSAAVRLCSGCRLMMTPRDSESLCSCCLDAGRRQDQLLIVLDSESAQYANDAGYNGQFWVLHQLLSPVDRIGPDDIGAGRLLERLRQLHARAPDLQVSIALPDSVEGRASGVFLTRLVESLELVCDVRSFDLMFQTKESK